MKKQLKKYKKIKIKNKNPEPQESGRLAEYKSKIQESNS
jgi:hypothetical protein